MPDVSDSILKPPLNDPYGYDGDGKRPVIFDILGPDRETSILPDQYRLVLWANPQEMSFTYSKRVERIQTRGGFVEQHWGDDAQSMSLTVASGGFMRLWSGLSNITSTEYGGTRRETLAYDRYLDFLALFHNNGSVYDAFGQVALQGIIKITFDGGVYLGWFTSFTVGEASSKPFQFSLSADFEIAEEIQVWRTLPGATSAVSADDAYRAATDATELATNSRIVSDVGEIATLNESGQITSITSAEQQAAQHQSIAPGQVYQNPDGTYWTVPEGGG
jgi:hypothetical protein